MQHITLNLIKNGKYCDDLTVTSPLKVKQEHRRVGANARLFFKSEKRHNSVIIKARVMWLCTDMCFIPWNICTKFHLKMLKGFELWGNVKVLGRRRRRWRRRQGCHNNSTFFLWKNNKVMHSFFIIFLVLIIGNISITGLNRIKIK